MGFLKIKNFGDKMIFIGNYTCSRSINEKSHQCLAKYLAIILLVLRTCGIKHFAKHACNFSLKLFGPCNFLY